MAECIIVDVTSLFMIEYKQGNNLCNEIGFLEPKIDEIEEWLKENCRHNVRWNIKHKPYMMKFHRDDMAAAVAFKMKWL
jgi:hypothetical protein